MKEFLYTAYRSAMRLYWRLTGGRQLTVFGVTLKVIPETVFPLYRSHRLPAGHHKSRIVRYGDYVQQHAICDFISRARGPLTVVEVGAHHGAYAVIVGKLLRQRGGGGRFIAIEPHPASYAILRENVRLNGLEDLVTCLQIGIADQSGEMWISDEGSESQLQVGTSGGGNRVQVRTLTDLSLELGLESVDLLLIDVEGAELPVLQGYPWDLMPLPKIFCEMHPYAWPDFSYTGYDFKRFMIQKNLRCIDMYLTEHTEFISQDYLGPTVLIR